MSEITAERQMLNMSPAAAVAYLTIKKELLDLEVLWDVSDSAVIEYLCAVHEKPNLRARDFKPKTHDGRRKESLNAYYTESGRERKPSEIVKGCDRIDNAILKRKEHTDERLEYFKTYHARSAERRAARARAQQRNKDVPLR
ncbi:MAG: hypothetical protein V3S98_06190 [Dehalococcoidia bacterium]